MYSQDLNALSEMLGMSKEAENEVVYRHLSWRKTKNRNIKDIIILDVIIVDSAYANTSHPCSFCRYAQPFNKLEYVNHSFKEFVDVPIGAIEKWMKKRFGLEMKYHKKTILSTLLILENVLGKILILKI